MKKERRAFIKNQCKTKTRKKAQSENESMKIDIGT